MDSASAAPPSNSLQEFQTVPIFSTEEFFKEDSIVKLKPGSSNH